MTIRNLNPDYDEYVRILGADLCRDLWERTYDRHNDCTPMKLNEGTPYEEPLTMYLVGFWASRLAAEVLG